MKSKLRSALSVLAFLMVATCVHAATAPDFAYCVGEVNKGVTCANQCASLKTQKNGAALFELCMHDCAGKKRNDCNACCMDQFANELPTLQSCRNHCAKKIVIPPLTGETIPAPL